MNILVIGSGGREHALCWKIAKSHLVDELYAAPGNPGTAKVATNVDVDFSDFAALKSFLLNKKIEMVVVGPETPLVEGIHDAIANDSATAKINVIGPKKAGALLEGSKEYSKQFMLKHGIATAKHRSFNAENLEDGIAYLETQNAPYVLKADGLAAGKGVLILNDLMQAKEELSNMVMGAKFGEASNTVVIEEYLMGLEFSVFALTDGKDYVILPSAKDYKRIGEGDTGLNTGGMGAISPVPFANPELMQKVEENIIKPTINGLQKDNIDFKGFLFFGLIRVDNEPMLIEYNVRLGDPETEAIMPRLKTDLVELMHACGNGTLGKMKTEFEDNYAVTVMLVSGGYPGSYPKGKKITGLKKVKNSIVFHAGTQIKDDELITSGGRVLAFTAMGETKQDALSVSYGCISKIDFGGMYYRKDIGFDL